MRNLAVQQHECDGTEPEREEEERSEEGRGPAEVLLKRGTWPLMTIRKRRWGVGLSEEVGEVIRETWKISEEFATVLEEFESAVSCSVDISRITVFILRAAHDSVPFSCCGQMS